MTQIGTPITPLEAITIAREILRQAEEERLNQNMRPITPLTSNQRSAIVFVADSFVEVFLNKLRPILRDIEHMSPDCDDDVLEDLVFNYINCALQELKIELTWETIKALIDPDDLDYLKYFEEVKSIMKGKYPNV